MDIPNLLLIAYNSDCGIKASKSQVKDIIDYIESLRCCGNCKHCAVIDVVYDTVECNNPLECHDLNNWQPIK